MSGARARPRPPGRSRPFALSPGVWAFAGAWVVGVAIARLTGAAAVVLVLAAGFAGFACAVVESWRRARGIEVRSVVAPDVVTVGEPAPLMLEISARRPVRGAWRLALATVDGHRLGEFTPGGPAPRAVDRRSAAVQQVPAGSCPLTACFAEPGVLDELTVIVETAGSSGLVWWRRCVRMTTEPLHVAPVASGPMVPVERRHGTRAGDASARHGSATGDVDGVRAWREGESTHGVHWPSTLRAGELIVHDRHEASETVWTIASPSATDAGRIRHTIDEGLRAGHRVRVALGDDGPLTIHSSSEAARVAARIAAGPTTSATPAAAVAVPARVSRLHREIRLPRSADNPERTVEVDATARWLAALAAAVALSMLVDALSGGALTIALLLAGLALGALVTVRFADRDGSRPMPLRIAVGAGAAGALAYIAGETDGLSGLLAALRGPLPDLLMLLVVLHGFEVSTRRTLRVHQALSFVVAVYAAGLRIDDRLGWWLAAWCVVFVAAVTATIHSTMHATMLPASHPSPGTPRLAAPLRGGALRSVTVWVTAAAAVTLAVLLVVPVPDGPASLGLPALSTGAPVSATGALVGSDGAPAASTPSDGTRGSLGRVGGYPGFSEALDTSVRGGLGDEIVMRVRSPEPAFWRGQTFTDFDGRTWTVSPDRGRPRVGPDIEVPPTLGDWVAPGVETDELIQTYFVEADLPNVVFAASRVDAVVFDGTIWTRPDGALRSDVTLTAGSVYTVVSERNRVTPEILRAQGDVARLFASVDDDATRATLAPLLNLPESTSARTIALATALNRPGRSTYDTILSYQAWLAANTSYDLNAPIPTDGADAVDDYLFESRRGFCEQIASALTVMLRSQGVPARLATGYLPGERDRVSGVWKVRASDAHAWVEVWFPQTGWEPFDPTAEVPLSGEANVGTVGGDLLSAAFSAVVAHPLELGAVLLLVLAGAAAVRSVSAARHRRSRGRWGLLQDRFLALAADPDDHRPTETRPSDTRPSGAPPDGAATNVRVCDLVGDRLDLDQQERATLRTIADELDRAVFDPAWTDDDALHDSVLQQLRRFEQLTGRSRRTPAATR